MKKDKPIGVQLYTVREEMEADVHSTLAIVDRIGYGEIEQAGYSNGLFYGYKPQAFKQLITDLGLAAPSGHFSTGFNQPNESGTIRKDWERAVADAVALGHKYMVIGYLHDGERTSLDDYKQHAENFNKAGEICKRYGVQFGYHNHAFEFEKMNEDEQMPYDILLSETDPDLVQFELDMYWAELAGQDPVALFNAHPGRFPLWHIKDMDDTEERFFTEVGNGVINFERIFAAAKVAGMQHFFVEQDQCRNHRPLDAIRISFNYLDQM